MVNNSNHLSKGISSDENHDVFTAIVFLRFSVAHLHCVCTIFLQLIFSLSLRRFFIRMFFFIKYEFFICLLCIVIVQLQQFIHRQWAKPRAGCDS